MGFHMKAYGNLGLIVKTVGKPDKTWLEISKDHMYNIQHVGTPVASP